ncbi:zinc metallopeptidase [Hallella sp.]|uniref:zinc metallopeptidase n=1 Tax=Hallella sp. TaxID=2980186 RepID=UPI0030801F6E
MYWILFIGIAVVSYLVQANLKRKFEKYSEVTVASGMTGAEVAQKMLRDNGIFDVRVQPHEGWLSDHYDPSCKTVNLSQDVYHSNSVAAAAVAAHECGHAVQHARGYAFLRLRSALVPAVQFSSSIMTWVILGGILLINVFPTLLLIGILLFALTTLFSFVTLPVEIDASRRATQWLQGAAITSHIQQPMAVDALRSAAYTYVVAALSSLATLVYYLSIYLSRRD